MVDGLKKFPARFYRSKTGNEPVRDWLKDLSLEDRKIVGSDIAAAEFGWPIGMPLCKPLGRGVWEIRSDISNGRTSRVIFCSADGFMVLLHAFVKKSQKTPKQDLDLALDRKKEL